LTYQTTTTYAGAGLLAWLALCFGVAWFGAQFEPGAWYEQLLKPPWTPPNWLFPPVWTILYALLAVAAWLVWKTAGFAGARLPLGLFFIQLLLNGVWSWLFFGLHAIGLALADIIVLWFAILATLVAFWRQRPLTGLLLLPYLIWVSFAVALNYSIWQINE
jgi:tryptophan-rich sensory protein